MRAKARTPATAHPLYARVRLVMTTAFVSLLGTGSIQCHVPEPSPPRYPAAGASDVADLDPAAVLGLDRHARPWGSEWWLRIAGPVVGSPEGWKIVASDDSGFDGFAVSGEGPVVVVLPHLEGTDRLARYFARSFANAGFQVLAVLPPTTALSPEATLEEAIEMLRRRVRVGRLAVRLASSELHASCTILLGVSLGALTVIPVAALELEVDGVVAMLAGGDLSWIAAHSKEPALRALRLDDRSSEELRRAVVELTAVDPLYWAAGIEPSRVLLVRALFDQVIPVPASRALRAAMGLPREKVYPSGHYSFGLFLPLATRSAIDHAEALCREQP